MQTRFPLSSEQLELLLAFESAEGGLARLAGLMRRDPSVISRSLSRLAEDAPVIAKRGTKWQLTPLGGRVNALTRQHLSGLRGELAAGAAPVEAYRRDGAVLMLINAQKALLDPARGTRSNPEAEANVARLLEHWRASRRPVLHVKHVASDLASAFHPSHPSSDFIPELAPRAGEWVIEKPGASAFSHKTLAADLEERGIDALVLAGFTANECIDATAKQATDLGFQTYVAGDATAMFDVVGPDGRVHPSGKTQEVLLASLHATFAKVLPTAHLI